jgi:hypothetical protein
MNLQRSFVVVMVTALAVLATVAAEEPTIRVAPEAKKLSNVEIEIADLAELGTEVFNIAARAKSSSGKLTFSSKLTLRTRVKEDHVAFVDTWKIMGRTCQLNMTCETDTILSLRECELDMEARGRTASGKITVANDVATGQVGGRQVTFNYPAGTVNLAAILRLVTVLPDDAGVSYTFPSYSEAIEIRAQQSLPGQTFSITCNGPEKIETENGVTECTKFTLDVRKPIELYVDEDSRLQKVVADAGDTIMIRQAETATATAESDAAEE